ncbi:MAG TPA: DUF2975 domain-containing protein [Ignavibacteriales bacterium]|nr:DUF2975 domain-containing protein [Ignavibacteriales bacterium]
MDLLSSNLKAGRITYYVYNIALAVLLFLTIMALATYPYKKFVLKDIVVDVEVNLQNRNFHGVIKTPDSTYSALTIPDGVFYMTPQNFWVYFLGETKYLLVIAAGIIAVWNWRNLAKRIKEEKTFDTDNSRIFRLLALIAVIIPLVLAVRLYLLNQYIPDNLVINGFKVIRKDPFSLRPILQGFFGGLVLLAISNAFRQGRKIKEENELTV